MAMDFSDDWRDSDDERPASLDIVAVLPPQLQPLLAGLDAHQAVWASQAFLDSDHELGLRGTARHLEQRGEPDRAARYWAALEAAAQMRRVWAQVGGCCG